MTWVKLDDKLFSNPKIIELSKDAKLLYISGLTYCAANLTDGKLTPGAVRVAASLVGVNPSRAKELVTARLWEATQDGFTVHHYLNYNPSASNTKRERAQALKRQAAWRTRNESHNGVTNTASNGVSNAVTNTCPVPVPVPVTLPSSPEVITHTVNAPCDGAECVSGPDPVESKAEPTARSPGRDRARLAASFDRWWAIWLKRVDRANALRVWLRLAPDDELVDAIVAATVEQNAMRYSKVALQFVPGPAKWLRGRMWEDEVIAIEETRRETNRHDYARARLTAGAAGTSGPGGHDSWSDEG